MASAHVKGGSSKDDASTRVAAVRSGEKDERHQPGIAVVAPSKPGRMAGPRTATGKKRASRNSLKHGIFARDLVLGSESIVEYEQLLAGFVESLQPVGEIEELLVEKLAVYTWRHRRLLRAEAAEIGVLRLESTPTDADRVRSRRLAMSFWPDQGSLGRAILSHEEEGLLAEVHTLKELRTRIEEHGLNWERDREEFEGLYGCSQAGSDRNDTEAGESPKAQGQAASVCERHRKLAEVFQSGDKATKASAKKMALEDLSRQIDVFLPMGMAARERKLHMDELRNQAGAIPKAETMERLLRYETSLERGFDRALSQLERLQRIRLGQAVLPPVRVELSS